jgi:nucleoside-diphosphate-sugar epimerase
MFVGDVNSTLACSIVAKKMHIKVVHKDCSIKEPALLVKKITGFKSCLEFDTARPNGTALKPLDVSRLEDFGWKAKIPLETGIREAYEWFVRNVSKKTACRITNFTFGLF